MDWPADILRAGWAISKLMACSITNCQRGRVRGGEREKCVGINVRGAGRMREAITD